MSLFRLWQPLDPGCQEFQAGPGWPTGVPQCTQRKLLTKRSSQLQKPEPVDSKSLELLFTDSCHSCGFSVQTQHDSRQEVNKLRPLFRLANRLIQAAQKFQAGPGWPKGVPQGTQRKLLQRGWLNCRGVIK